VKEIASFDSLVAEKSGFEVRLVGRFAVLIELGARTFLLHIVSAGNTGFT